MMVQYPDDKLLRYNGALGADRILVTDPEAIREVLQEKSYMFHKSRAVKRVTGPIIGNGILMAEGNTHRYQKKALTPVFAPRHIKALHPVLWKKTQGLVSALSKELDQPSSPSKSKLIEFSPWAARATLDVIGVAGLGRDFETVQHPDSAIGQAYRTLFPPRKSRDIRTVLAVILPLSILQLLPLKRNRDITTANRTIRKFCQQAITEAKTRAADPDEKPQTTILDLALKSQVFDDDNLTDQLLTFLVAGHETTSLSLSWTVHFLAQNPDVQDRLRKEIEDNFIVPNATDDPFDALPYLSAVCNESLRLMPVISTITREAAETTTILSQPIPAGTFVAISPFAINRSPAHWGPDAEDFKPERWLGNQKTPANGPKGSVQSFFTFSHGPRACIGQTLARAELSMLVVGLVRSFRFNPAGEKDDGAVEFGFVSVKPSGGLRVRLERV